MDNPGARAGGPAEDGRRVALVTGASSGIGASFARALRARGETVVLVARRADRLQTMVDALGGERVATAIPLDLTSPAAGAALEAELQSRRLTVDLLVNNAGLGDTGRFDGESLDRVLRMIDLNVRAVVELTRRLLPGMVARNRGRIVNVASTAAFQPVPFLNVYAATKAFVLSFTEALATEVRGTGVRVQALCPGLTATEFQQVAGTDRVAFNRSPAMTADEVAATSLAALDRGRLTVIPGLRNRLMVALQRFVPRAVVRSVAGRMFHPPGRPAGA